MKHKKLIFLILIFLIIYIIFNANNKNNINYISLGDEVSLGINENNKVKKSYSDYIKDYINNKNKLKTYTKNYSKRQYKINDLYNDILINRKISNQRNIRKDLREASIVTLSIGMNDIIYKMSLGEERKEIEDDINNEYKKLLNEIKKYYSKKIYILSIINIYPNNLYKTNMINNINKKLKELENEKIVFIEITSEVKVLKNKQDYLKKYPNQTENKVISSKIINNFCGKSKKTCKI